MSLSMNVADMFQVRQVMPDGSGEGRLTRGLGIATMLAEVVACGPTAPIAILPDGDEARPHPTREEFEGDIFWSAWIFAHRRWKWLVIGANSLDEACEEIVAALCDAGNAVEEIRLCPPGAPLPRKLG